MSKLLLGILVGTTLGLIDGLSAFLDGVAASAMPMVVVGSAFKGLLGGLAAGLVAQRTPKAVPVLLTGIVVLALVTHPIAGNATLDGTEAGPKVPYWRIMAPGLVVGLITGYACVRYGRRPEPKPAA